MSEISPRIGMNELAKRSAGPVIAMRADGYLGQYIVVVPQARLVAVRQITEERYTGEADSDPDFEQQVIALAKALGTHFPEAPATP